MAFVRRVPDKVRERMSATRARQLISLYPTDMIRTMGVAHSDFVQLLRKNYSGDRFLDTLVKHNLPTRLMRADLRVAHELVSGMYGGLPKESAQDRAVQTPLVDDRDGDERVPYESILTPPLESTVAGYLAVFEERLLSS